MLVYEDKLSGKPTLPALPARPRGDTTTHHGTVPWVDGPPPPPPRCPTDFRGLKVPPAPHRGSVGPSLERGGRVRRGVAGYGATRFSTFPSSPHHLRALCLTHFFSPNAGDELCSDSYPSEVTTDGCFLEVQGSWIVKGEVEIDTGANPSAEGGDDDIGGGSNEQKVVDIIDAFELVEQGEYGKKDLMSYFKGWLASIMEHIEEDQKDDFKVRVQTGIKRLVGLRKELQVFTGPSMDPDATMVFAYYKEGASAPTFIYFKDAMREVKC